MTFKDQYRTQAGRALMLSRVTGAQGLALVAVKWPGEVRRVSIVGHAISWAAVDLWRHMGARVRVLRRVS